MIGMQHYNSDLVRAIAENVTLAWNQLRNHSEERHKLVMASMTWYKTAEQVGLYRVAVTCGHHCSVVCLSA
jgi:hypothetical protein